MLFRTQGQRHGRVLPWVIGLLAACFLALTGYEYWINLDRQVENRELMDEAQSTDLATAKDRGADPKDWPQWRGPNRDGIAPGAGLLDDWPEGGPPVLWRAEGGGGLSSLAVADGRAFTLLQKGDREVVACWNAVTGKRLWDFSYEAHFTRDAVGPRSTPTVDGDLVYTVGALGHLCCFEAATGRQVWHSDLRADFDAPLPSWGFAFSPLVEGDLLLTSPGGPDGSSIVAFDKRTGDVRWRALDDPVGYSSPVLCDAGGTRQVLFLTGTALVSLDPRTGKLYWRFPWETPHQANAATPLVLRGDAGEGYVFLSSGYGQGCALLKVSQGSDGAPRAEQVYANNLMRNQYASSVFLRGHFYGFDEGYLVCMPLKGRRRAWKERKFQRGTLLAAGDRLLVLGQFGDLALVEATPEEYREKALFNLTDRRCWAVPSLAQGLLYVRDDRQVLCLDLRKRR